MSLVSSKNSVQPLTHICNKSFKSGIFSDEIKMAKIDRFNDPWRHHATEFHPTVTGYKFKNHCTAWRFTRVVADKCITEKLYLGYLPAIFGYYL